MGGRPHRRGVLIVAAAIAALVRRGQAKEITPAAPRTVETVKADIERTRKELGDNRRSAVGQNLDVNERTTQKVAETKEHVVESAQAVRRLATGDPRVVSC